jgi:hypothetical protein
VALRLEIALSPLAHSPGRLGGPTLVLYTGPAQGRLELVLAYHCCRRMLQTPLPPTLNVIARNFYIGQVFNYSRGVSCWWGLPGYM